MRKSHKFFGNIFYWLAWPGIYFILSGTHRSRVIINVEDKVLFVDNWLGGNRLSLPGGGIKSGESSKQAAVREVYEETGISLDPQNLKLVAENIKASDNGIGYLVDCYSVSLPKTTTTKSRHVEIYRSTWQPWKQKINTKQLSKTTNQLLQAWLSMQHLVD